MTEFIIADNQAISNVGLIHLLNADKNLSAISIVENKSELTKTLRNIPEAIVVLDYTLFDFRSIDELLQLHEQFQHAHWLLFSSELNTNFLRQIITGYSAFSVVMKTSSKEEILLAIHYAIKKERFICTQVSNLLLAAIGHQATLSKTAAANSLLTSSELAILKEIALGKTTKEIASHRNLSFHTINTHRKNIFRKLEANNVHDVIKKATRLGLIDLTEYYI